MRPKEKRPRLNNSTDALELVSNLFFFTEAVILSGEAKEAKVTFFAKFLRGRTIRNAFGVQNCPAETC